MPLPVLANLPWSSILPAALKAGAAAYKHRAWLSESWTRLQLAVGQKSTDILFTGGSGVGKTLLFDQLMGAAGSFRYEKSDISRTVEVGVTGIGGKGRLLTVLPGQQVRERDAGLTSAFHGSVDGVVHVVANGFATIREDALRARLVQSGVETVGQLRAHNESLELEDFEEICGFIRRAFAVGKGPKWLMIVVNKADIWWPRRDDVERSYGINGASPFSAKLNRFRSGVGEQSMKIELVPTVAWTENFEWNGQIVASQMSDETERRALLSHFVDTLAQLGGKR